MKKYIFTLILITVLAYLSSFSNDFVWDDLNNIVNSKQLDGPVIWQNILFKLQPPAQFYRPIPSLAIVLDHFLWGKNPFGYHLTNFLFHLFNVMLIFYITTRLCNSSAISFICALLFAIHPIQTEAITYISGRSDPICGFFLFTAFLFYLKSFNTRYRQFVYFGLALVLFLLGLLSKEIAIVFPFIVFAYEYLYLNSRFKSCLKRSMPFFAVLSSFLVFRYIFLAGPIVKLDLNKIFLAPKILIYYIRLLIFPIKLHMQHRLEDASFLINMPFILSLLIFIGLIYIGLRFAKRRFMKFSLAWFLIGVFPFLGIIILNADIAEHWLYLASFGFFLFLAGLFAQIKPLNRKIALSIAVLFLSILTFQRNTVWRDDISIYQDALKYRPNDTKLHYNLGNAYLRHGLLNEAAKEYSIAIKHNPDYAYALNNLGLVMERQGDTKAAHQHYEMAITSDPELDAAQKNLSRFRFSPLETTEKPVSKKMFLTGFTSLAFAEEIYFNHSLYGEVLRKFVDDGKVDYAALKNNPHPLDSYLTVAAKLDSDALNSLPRNEKIAFYINVYNALTLKVITDYYPVESIKAIPGVWDRIKFKVAGRELTLNQIEHDILRNEFKEPRIHFALVCASKGCPELASGPFSGKDLDAELDREARKFINDKAKVRLDRGNRTLYISSIFKWFNEDFGDIIKFISKYLSEDEAEFIEKTKPKIKYPNYDWSLNEKL